MKSQIKLGRIFGIEIGLHYSFLIIAVLIVLSLASYFSQTHPGWSGSNIWTMAILSALLFFIALVLHELSHALVAQLNDLPVGSITLFALGGAASIEKESPDAKTEFWLGIIGPFTSLMIGLICLGLAYLSGWIPASDPETPMMAILVWLGFVNIALAFFNMIPGYPMDGGRVLRSFIWRITGNAVRATKIASAISQLTAFGFIFFGLIIFFHGTGFGGLWIAFIGWFLLSAAKAELLQVELSDALRGVMAGDLMLREFPALDGNLDLQNVVENYLLKTGQRVFPVSENGAFAGLITPHEIKTIDRNLWKFKTVSDAMRPLEKLHTVAPETPAFEALEIIGREAVNQLPVVETGKLKGIISREQILNYLFTRKELNL